MADIQERAPLSGVASGIDMASFFFSDTQAAPPALSAHSARPMLTAVHSRAAVELASRRTEVTPPALFTQARPQWHHWAVSFWHWLWDMDEEAKSETPATGLRSVKSEFNSALWDLQSLRANQVRDNIEAARSLRELWHLRAEVFKVVALHRGQIEAQLRLDALDAHFPVRSSSPRADEPRHGTVTRW